MKFTPLHDRVLIEVLDSSEKTAGGIIIPDTAQEKPQEGKDWVWDGGVLREKFAEKTYQTINTLVDQKALDEKKLSLFNDFLSNI